MAKIVIFTNKKYHHEKEHDFSYNLPTLDFYVGQIVFFKTRQPAFILSGLPVTKFSVNISSDPVSCPKEFRGDSVR